MWKIGCKQDLPEGSRCRSASEAFRVTLLPEIQVRVSVSIGIVYCQVSSAEVTVSETKNGR